MKFKQPFYVSPHAVDRFRERVANLPTRIIRIVIQAALQDSQQQVSTEMYNHKPCPVYRAKYLDIEYFIPVIHERYKQNAWPVVPTILTSDMELVRKRTKEADGIGTNDTYPANVSIGHEKSSS